MIVVTMYIYCRPLMLAVVRGTITIIIQLPLLFSADSSVLSASVGVIRPYLEKEMRELVLMSVSLSS